MRATRAGLIAAGLIAGCLLAIVPPAFADDPVTINQVVASGANTSTINQVGSNNSAETSQLGGQNYVGIGQFGNNNASAVTQTGIGGLVIHNQYGNGNQLTIMQTGPHPQPVMITQHR
jgi:hypothetical protein